MPKINTDGRPDDLFHGTDPNKGGKKRSAKRRNNDSEYLNGALIRRDWPSNEPDQLFVPVIRGSFKIRAFSNKIIRIFCFTTSASTTFEFLNFIFPSDSLFHFVTRTRDTVRATKFRFTANIHTRDKRTMHTFVVSMRSSKRISFPSSIANISKNRSRSCTFNYTVIQMASFT